MGFHPRRCEKGGGGVRGGRIWGPGGGGCCGTAAVRPPSASSLLVPPPRRALQGTWPPWLLEPLFMTLWALFHDAQPIFVTLRAPFCTTLGALCAHAGRSHPAAKTRPLSCCQIPPSLLCSPNQQLASCLSPCPVPSLLLSVPKPWPWGCRPRPPAAPVPRAPRRRQPCTLRYPLTSRFSLFLFLSL